MRWLAKLQIVFYTFLWFLVLPFPFEIGWKWFGGYHLLRAAIPFTSDGFRYEHDISTAYYSHSYYRLVLIAAALALGYLTYFGLGKLLKRRA